MHAARNVANPRSSDGAQLRHALFITKIAIPIAQTKRSINIIFGLINEKIKYKH